MRSRDPRLPLPTTVLLLVLFALSAAAQAPAPATPAPTAISAGLASHPWPNVLLVTAHPDDDALFGGAVYKITHQLGGRVDLFLVTNGEGGFHYSTLSEPIYGLKLSDEKVGREYLPGIRKREL